MRGPAVRPIVIAAGGTGGHFFPAEALASTLIARGHRVVLMTDARTGAQLGPVFSGGESHVLHGAGLAGRGVGKAARAFFSLAAGTLQARRILSSLDAACIIGFGGYPSVPPMLAARSLRRRPAIILHEQNAVLGRANRFLVPIADLVALGFEKTSRLPVGKAALFTGNPVREAIRALHGRVFELPDERIELLVLGGSLGARVFTDVVPAALQQLPQALRSRLHVVQQCRVEDLGRARAAYRVSGVEAELAPFFVDIADRLGAAHLVISRAGASTCAELGVSGRPAILVPLPSAIDDHQTANAKALTGAEVVAQADFTSGSLAMLLSKFLTDTLLLKASAVSIGKTAQPNSASDLADAVERLMTRVEQPK